MRLLTASSKPPLGGGSCDATRVIYAFCSIMTSLFKPLTRRYAHARSRCFIDSKKKLDCTIFFVCMFAMNARLNLGVELRLHLFTGCAALPTVAFITFTFLSGNKTPLCQLEAKIAFI